MKGILEKEIAEKEGKKNEYGQQLKEKKLLLEEMEEKLKEQQAEQIKGKEILNKKATITEQLHKKLTEILNEKSNYLDKIEELESENKL